MKLQQAQELAEALKAELSPFCERIEIGGSIRRKKPDPGDIELICIPKFAEIGTGQVTLSGSETTTTENLLFDHISKKYFVLKMGDKYAQIQIGDEADVGIKVDIFTATESTWGYIFMLRTGSAEFSKWVVTELKRRGFAPKKGAIWDITPIGDDLIGTLEETDVFKLLQIDYIEPTQRIIEEEAI